MNKMPHQSTINEHVMLALSGNNKPICPISKSTDTHPPCQVDGCNIWRCPESATDFVSGPCRMTRRSMKFLSITGDLLDTDWKKVSRQPGLVCWTYLRPCGGVYSLLGQIYLDHFSARGKLLTVLTRLVNRVALWLDKRNLDADDTLGWMCVAEKKQL